MGIMKFDYVAPRSLSKALQILDKKGKHAVIMAGGTDLLVKIKRNIFSPKLVIGLKKIKSLNSINYDEKTGLTIGATVSLSEIAEHKRILEKYPTIAKAASLTANPQIRNMGTIVGNICNASPSADNAPTLLAMNTVLNISSPVGSRKVPLDQFFLGPGITTLSHNEIVTSIFIPKMPSNSGTAYLSLSQRSSIDCSAVGAGTMLSVLDGKFKDVRLFIGACAPVPVRVPKAEQLLKGKPAKEELINKASLEASREVTPITDLRASYEYRRKMVFFVSKKVLTKAKIMATKKIDPFEFTETTCV